MTITNADFLKMIFITFNYVGVCEYSASETRDMGCTQNWTYEWLGAT